MSLSRCCCCHVRPLLGLSCCFDGQNGPLDFPPLKSPHTHVAPRIFESHSCQFFFPWYSIVVCRQLQIAVWSQLVQETMKCKTRNGGERKRREIYFLESLLKFTNGSLRAWGEVVTPVLSLPGWTRSNVVTASRPSTESHRSKASLRSYFPHLTLPRSSSPYSFFLLEQQFNCGRYLDINLLACCKMMQSYHYYQFCLASLLFHELRWLSLVICFLTRHQDWKFMHQINFSQANCVCGVSAIERFGAHSCPTLCDPMDYGPPGSCVHLIF